MENPQKVCSNLIQTICKRNETSTEPEKLTELVEILYFELKCVRIEVLFFYIVNRFSDVIFNDFIKL